ncbi:MAG: hypothetical protein QOH06_5056 [Acidobacteriota bacterium]|jgi:hypothetical protein|nr:hypothetical protein [Acidobacteriota bacterium]
MKVLSLFIEPAGSPARMKAVPNDDVLAYTVFIRRWTPQGPLPHLIWFPEQLESPEGATLDIGADSGYDFILMASIRPNAHAAINIDLEFGAPGAGSFSKPVALPNSEGPVVQRVWKVIIRPEGQ